MDHKRRDGLLNNLREKYYWKGMFQDVNRVVGWIGTKYTKQRTKLGVNRSVSFSFQLESCEVCSAQRTLKSKEREEREATNELDEYVQPILNPRSRRVRAKKSAQFVDKPTTPEPNESDKYPETSEVPIGGTNEWLIIAAFFMEATSSVQAFFPLEFFIGIFHWNFSLQFFCFAFLPIFFVTANALFLLLKMKNRASHFGKLAPPHFVQTLWLALISNWALWSSRAPQMRWCGVWYQIWNDVWTVMDYV